MGQVRCPKKDRDVDVGQSRCSLETEVAAEEAPSVSARPSGPRLHLLQPTSSQLSFQGGGFFFLFFFCRLSLFFSDENKHISP